VTIVFGEPEPGWEESPPEWVDRLFGVMTRADRASAGECMDCGRHPLGQPCDDEKGETP
jgi:hypothetical protein